MAIRESHILKDAVKVAEIAANSAGTEELIDGAVTTPKLADAPNGATTTKINDLAVTNPKVADATLAYGKLAANEVQLIIDVPILSSGSVIEVAADAVATPTFAHTTVQVPAEALKHLKSASVIIDHAWAATADGTIQLYDSTAAAVRGETATFTGGEASEWLSFSVSGLVAGNTMVIRANVTAAGAAGEKSGLYRAILRLVLGVS